LRDLLSSGPRERAFVVEMEEDGSAQLLFGQNGAAARPEAGEAFRAIYRVGRGPAGNVGAGAISLLVHRTNDLSNEVSRVRNPLAAQGGIAPETMAEAKLNAPHAFRAGPSALQRAITAGDYAQLAERDPRLQSAVAKLRWTGSWMEADVAFDPLCASETVEPVLPSQIEQQVEPFRRLGQDLRAQPAVRVPILLRLAVCIAPGYLQAHVRRALLDAFSTRALPNGELGFFHPDRLTFGGHLYLSVIIAEAQQIPGVVSVRVTTLQRQFAAANHEVEQGILRLAPFEIAQLENGPNYPDRGRIEIEIGGGR
jgi:predicted phage baseplate assembly protein